MAATVSKLAAVVYPDGDLHGESADALVLAFCHGLQRLGWQVGGLTQRRVPAPGGGKPALELVDLRSGAAYPVSQNLGPHAQGCSIDAGRVADASRVLRQALHDRVQLAVTNRFGELEAGGGGFAAEIAGLAGAGIPVLTIAAPKHLEAWRRFTGGEGDELPARAAALRDWFMLAAEKRTPA